MDNRIMMDSDKILHLLDLLEGACFANDIELVEEIIFKISPVQLGVAYFPTTVFQRVSKLIEDDYTIDLSIHGYLLNYFQFDLKKLTLAQSHALKNILKELKTKKLTCHSEVAVNEILNELGN